MQRQTNGTAAPLANAAMPQHSGTSNPAHAGLLEPIYKAACHAVRRYRGGKVPAVKATVVEQLSCGTLRHEIADRAIIYFVLQVMLQHQQSCSGVFPARQQQFGLPTPLTSPSNGFLAICVHQSVWYVYRNVGLICRMALEERLLWLAGHQPRSSCLVLVLTLCAAMFVRAGTLHGVLPRSVSSASVITRLPPAVKPTPIANTRSSSSTTKCHAL
jgi:hypothetical protein